MVNYAAFLAGRSASVWTLRKTNAEPSNSITSGTEQLPQRMHYWRDLRFERRPLGENVTYSGRGGAWVRTYFSQLREVLRLSNALPGGKPGERFRASAVGFWTVRRTQHRLPQRWSRAFRMALTTPASGSTTTVTPNS